MDTLLSIQAKSLFLNTLPFILVMSELETPPSKGRGRPRKYPDEESRRQAKRQQEKESKKRRAAAASTSTETQEDDKSRKRKASEQWTTVDSTESSSAKRAKTIDTLRERLNTLAKEVKSIRSGIVDIQRSCAKGSCDGDGILQCWLECDVWFCAKHYMDRSLIHEHLDSCPYYLQQEDADNEDAVDAPPPPRESNEPNDEEIEAGVTLK